MKIITVKSNEVQIATNSLGKTRVLYQGKHLLFGQNEIQKYVLTDRIRVTDQIQLLIERSGLMNHLHLVSIEPNEMGVAYRNGMIQEILSPGMHAYWKNGLVPAIKTIQTNSESSVHLPAELTEFLVANGHLRKIQIENNHRGVLYIEGICTEILAAGVHYYWNNHRHIKCQMVDLRLTSLPILGQEILTKDKASIRLNVETKYKVVNINKAVLQTADYHQQLYSGIQMIVRKLIGTKTLDEILAKKSEHNNILIDESKGLATSLGIEIQSIGIKDIILPGEIRAIYQQVLAAQKRAEANAIKRREETAATRSLLNTAKLMENNAMLIKLKEMEYMENFAEKVDSIRLDGGVKALRELIVEE